MNQWYIKLLQNNTFIILLLLMKCSTQRTGRNCVKNSVLCAYQLSFFTIVQQACNIQRSSDRPEVLPYVYSLLYTTGINLKPAALSVSLLGPLKHSTIVRKVWAFVKTNTCNILLWHHITVQIWLTPSASRTFRTVAAVWKSPIRVSIRLNMPFRYYTPTCNILATLKLD